MHRRRSRPLFVLGIERGCGMSQSASSVHGTRLVMPIKLLLLMPLLMPADRGCGLDAITLPGFQLSIVAAYARFSHRDE